MRKNILTGVFVIFFLVFTLSLIIFQKTAFIFSENIDSDYLGNLREQAQVECLINSQCYEGYECVNNLCVDSAEINICQKVNLSTDGRQINTNSNINSAKRVLAKKTGGNC